MNSGEKKCTFASWNWQISAINRLAVCSREWVFTYRDTGMVVCLTQATANEKRGNPFQQAKRKKSVAWFVWLCPVLQTRKLFLGRRNTSVKKKEREKKGKSIALWKHRSFSYYYNMQHHRAGHCGLGYCGLLMQQKIYGAGMKKNAKKRFKRKSSWRHILNCPMNLLPGLMH